MWHRWTWFLLICAFVACEFIFIGTFAEAAITPVRGHTSSLGARSDIVDCYQEEYARSMEFIGFGNWSEFTANCCCMSRANHTSVAELDGHVTELWACSNPFGLSERVLYKERKRRPVTVEEVEAYPYLADPTRVSPVRPFCGTRFLGPDGSETDAVMELV